MKTKISNLLHLLTATLVLQALAATCFAHGMSEEERQAIIAGGNLAYMQIGATHMLTGYDHLLFVFGIIFFLRSFQDIVKYVTAFTVGHSITLIIATFNGIQLNYFLIDAIVGLSVCYIAFANIDGFRRLLDIEPPNMLAMVLGLGLIHGFGLSSRLQELPLAENSLDLLLNIISFNIGIELGQVFALLVMILAMDVWRKRPSFAKLSIVCNQMLIVAGALLFLYQMHGYVHTTLPETAMAAVSSPLASGQAISEETQWDDEITITIPARDDIEYKFHVEKGAAFDYSWDTDVDLEYDFHGEPDGSVSSFASYKQGSARQDSGSLTAPFTGIHGWYWKNTSAQPVDVRLMAKGNYQRTDGN